MSVYTEKSVQGLRNALTTFRAEGGYITFYKESDYAQNKVRSLMTPLGTYLFVGGITITENIKENTPLQSFGSPDENLTCFSVVSSTVALNGLYVQEGSDPAWYAAGHEPLIAYVDFFMSGGVPQANDTLNSNYELQQTVVVRRLRVASKAITATDASGVTYALSFNGGRVTRLANTTMDL